MEWASSSFLPPSQARESLPRTAIRGPGREAVSRRGGRLPGLRPPLPQAEAAPHPALSLGERVFRARRDSWGHGCDYAERKPSPSGRGSSERGEIHGDTDAVARKESPLPRGEGLPSEARFMGTRMRLRGKKALSLGERVFRARRDSWGHGCGCAERKPSPSGRGLGEGRAQRGTGQQPCGLAGPCRLLEHDPSGLKRTLNRHPGRRVSDDPGSIPQPFHRAEPVMGEPRIGVRGDGWKASPVAARRKRSIHTDWFLH